MEVELLARLQFALTIMFHYIYPPLSIGLGLLLVLIEAVYLKTKKQLYLQMAKFWTKVFALTFALGVATGIVMEFEFGTNWSAYARYVGDVFGSALAAEGVFAFFLESGFLALLLFGWDRVGPKTHFFSTLMVALGAHFSAIWIIVANSWMQTPAGFQIVGEGMQAKAQITDFWQMVFNPSSMDRLLHSIIGAWLAGAFLVISLSAYYILTNRFLAFSKGSLKFGLPVAFAACVLQLISGDHSAKGVHKNQPAKFAAMEGIYKTEKKAPLWLFGVPNTQQERVEYGIGIPGLLGYLISGDAAAEMQGLDKITKADRPHVGAVFQAYHLMVLMWGCMFLLSALGLVYWIRGKLFTQRWLLWGLVLAVLCPQIANQAGWVTAEMGRYPWIVYGQLRISEGLSKSVVAEQVLGSLIMFTLLYLMLFLLFLYLLNEKFKHGPDSHEQGTPYHHLALCQVPFGR
jgi:cytochrome bd ubiquinol oxidase subunit I